MLPVYPKSATALTDARVVAVTWVLLALSGVTWLSHKLLGAPSVLIQAVFAIFVVSGFVHVAMSFRHKCPSCGKHPTIQGFKPPHPNSIGQSKASGWAGAVVNILRRHRLVCIHCGAEFQINA
jgi:hypothetical protein